MKKIIIYFSQLLSIHNKKKGKKIEDKNSPMSNVVNSMFNSQELYNSLKVKCHPDKFFDEEVKIKAEILFQSLSENRYNFEKMKELEKEINNLNNL